MAASAHDEIPLGDTVPSVEAFLSSLNLELSLKKTLGKDMTGFPPLTPTVVSQLTANLLKVDWKGWSDQEKSMHLWDCIETGAILYRKCKEITKDCKVDIESRVELTQRMFSKHSSFKRFYYTDYGSQEAKGDKLVRPSFELALTYAKAARLWNESLSQSVATDLQGDNNTQSLQKLNSIYKDLLTARKYARKCTAQQLTDAWEVLVDVREKESKGTSQSLNTWCSMQEWKADFVSIVPSWVLDYLLVEGVCQKDSAHRFLRLIHTLVWLIYIRFGDNFGSCL